MASDRRVSVVAARPDALLGWMGSLADPTRMRLLRLLERQELGVAELCDIVQLPQSTVSRHLKVLADQGWLRSRAQRTNNLYRMDLEGAETAARKLWALTREQTEGWATSEQDQLRLRRVLARRAPVEDFFSGAAGRWDKLREELYGRAFAQEALLALLPPEWVVADLGCGTGQVAASLAPHVRTVIGVDQSAAMLKAARRRTSGLASVELRQGSLEALPIEAESCDAALMLLALTYVEEPAVALAEAGRILRPGGRLVAVDLLRHDREEFRREMGQVRAGFEAEELHALLESAGLQDVEVRPLPPEAHAKGPALLLAAGRGYRSTRSRTKSFTTETNGDRREREAIGDAHETGGI